MAFRIHSNGVQFFDPNLGELDYPYSESDAFDAFCDNWWESFYAGQSYNKFLLEAVKVR